MTDKPHPKYCDCANCRYERHVVGPLRKARAAGNRTTDIPTIVSRMEMAVEFIEARCTCPNNGGGDCEACQLCQDLQLEIDALKDKEEPKPNTNMTEAVEAAEAVASALNIKLTRKARKRIASIITEKMLPVAKAAYREGHNKALGIDRAQFTMKRMQDYHWEASNARAALTKGGE